MFKVSVLYPNAPGARFDHDYYRDSHMPMVKAKMGDALHHYTVEKGLAGGAPGQPAAYIAAGHLYVESLEAFQGAMATHGREIMGDIPNYTDQQPTILVSEVVVG